MAETEASLQYLLEGALAPSGVQRQLDPFPWGSASLAHWLQ